MSNLAGDQSLIQNDSDTANKPYELTISRLTIDKLGVKLYDKVSAVVAELIANGYDADAELVTVRLPLSTVLANKGQNGQPLDHGFTIEVEDDGHGMTPTEAANYYLQVGRDRRKHVEQGSRSREKQRPVMGRKGIGKLAPFGICKRIEVLSAGGPPTPNGYLISHFFMDFDTLVSDTDKPVPLDPGPLDRTYRANRGTLIRLSCFLPKRVPDEETFHRQLATRFVFARPDFSILVKDMRHPLFEGEVVKTISIPVQDGTRIDLSTRPVVTDEDEHLPVTGWLGMAVNPYKNEELAGVRLYARGKIIGMTRDFEQPAGFTGEFTMRSYLVGEVVAEWLDRDDGEDLIRTDRQSILWDSDYGRALRAWGAKLIREIGAMSRAPRRKRASTSFLEKSQIEARAKEKFGDKEVAKVAVDLAKQIGSFADEDELEDPVYVDDLSEVILSVAPHRALIQAFQDFGKQVVGSETPLERIMDLFDKARIAEMASYSQIAAERVRAIRELEKIIVNSNVDESEFQKLLADAPWLIEPTWSVISKNQQLKTFKTLFEAYWKQRTGEAITLAIGFERKRPDFTLISVGRMLHIVEIKTAGHTFDDTDFERMVNYVQAFDDFFENHRQLSGEFPGGWRIDLIADAVDLRKLPNRYSFEAFVEAGKVLRMPWGDFLSRAKIAHEMFLNVSDYAQAQETLSADSES